MKNALILLLSLLALTSCRREDSADVNQDRIHTDYEVFYNSNTDKTWVVARFRFGNNTGTLLELNDPANVSFNGEDLPYNVLFGGHYKEYAGQVTTGTFEYTDVDGSTFSNEVPEYDVADFPPDLDTISKSEAYELEWMGTALTADQYVGIFIGSWAWGQDAAFLQVNEGATSVIMGKDRLEDLPLGQSTIFMDRSTDEMVQEGTSAGGRVRYKYRTTNATVTIVD